MNKTQQFDIEAIEMAFFVYSGDGEDKELTPEQHEARRKQWSDFKAILLQEKASEASERTDGGCTPIVPDDSPCLPGASKEKNRAVHSAFKFEAPEWANTVAPEDAEEALRRAEDLAQAYYPLGVQTGVHSMIEWCGVMSEYAKMLRYAADTHGMDPRDVDIHHGIPVDIPDYMVEYLAEKLGCQFTPFIKAAPEEWRKAIDKWFH